MRLKILTPERTVLDIENVDEVFAKSTEGEFGILPKHLPLVAPLSISVLRYTEKGDKKSAVVMGGMFSTDGQSVTVLTDSGELSAEIDEARAKHAMERAKARLKEKKPEDDLKRAQDSLDRAQTRLKAMLQA